VGEDKVADMNGHSYLLPWEKYNAADDLDFPIPIYRYRRRFTDKTYSSGWFYVERAYNGKWRSVERHIEHDTVEEAMKHSDVVLEEQGYILLNEKTVLLI
jgi:hypothetical protein